jgi:hypothetical protein
MAAVDRTPTTRRANASLNCKNFANLSARCKFLLFNLH